jgi:hypothetical protein
MDGGNPKHSERRLSGECGFPSAIGLRKRFQTQAVIQLEVYNPNKPILLSESAVDPTSQSSWAPEYGHRLSSFFRRPGFRVHRVVTHNPEVRFRRHIVHLCQATSMTGKKPNRSKDQNLD